MLLSNSIFIEGGILFFITMILEIILLKYNLYLIKNLLRNNNTFMFDKKLNEFENLKNYKAYILMDYLYEFNIRTVKQFEIYKEIIKQEIELSKTSYKYTLSIGIPSLISIIIFIAGYLNNFLPAVIFTIFLIGTIVAIEYIYGQFKYFGFTKESKYINILILVNIGLLKYKTNDNKIIKSSFSIFE